MGLPKAPLVGLLVEEFSETIGAKSVSYPIRIPYLLVSYFMFYMLVCY